MKKILLILLLLPVFAIAQSDSSKLLKDTLPLAHLPIDENGNITYNLIENLPGINKSDIYQRGKIWAALAFNSAKYVTQFDDITQDNIVIKALSVQYYTYKFLGASYPVQYYMYFSLHFTFKDNKYRATLEMFSIEIPASTEVTPEKYRLESLYKSLSEWNNNVKIGNGEFNKTLDMSKREARLQCEIINNLNTFATTTMADIKRNMQKSGKGEDF